MLTDCVSYHIKNEILVGVGASTSICAVIGLDFAYKIYKVDNQ